MSQFFSDMSIRLKILTGSVVSILLISTFMLIYYPIHEKEIIYKTMQLHNHALAEMLAIGVGTAMGSGDFEAILDAIDMAKRDTDMLSVIVLDEHQQSVIRFNRDSVTVNLPKLLRSKEIQMIENHKVHVVFFPITYRDDSFGTLIYISSLERIDATIYESTTTTIKVSLGLLLVGALLSFIFSRMITRPLDRLRHAAVDLANGQGDVQIPEGGADEIGQLSRTFNEMSRNIQNTMANLRESREQSRLIIETAADAFISIDESAAVVEWNSMAEKTFGWLKEEILGTSLIDSIIPPAYKKAHMAGLNRFLISNQGTIINRQVEISALHRDGHEFPIELTLWVVYRDGQKYFNAFIRDITERIKNQEQLLKLSAAVEQSANMVCVIDNKHIIEYINPQFSKVTGLNPADIIGRPMSSIYSECDDPRTGDLILESLNQGINWSGKIHSRRKNGESYWVRQTVTRIRNNEGIAANYLIIGEDVTDEVKLQRKMTDADKMTAVGTLAAGVAHEFKNYLCGIIGNASFALAELQDDRGDKRDDLSRETFEEIIDLGEKANEIAMSLLSFSLEGKGPIRRVDISKIIEDCLKLISKNIRAKVIQIKKNMGITDAVEVNQNKIQQLIMNLLINAIQAVENNGIITITTSQEANRVIVQVRDNGRGIDSENLTRIFDPFFSTKGVWGDDESPGVGMGLTVCRNIAREHGGDLKAESTPGRGSIFTLILPIKSVLFTRQRDDCGKARPTKIVLMSTDDNQIRCYQEESTLLNCNITALKDSSLLEKEFSRDCDLVIFDASYPAKIELFMGIEQSLSKGMATIVINCDHIQQAIPDIFDREILSFPQTPPMEKIVSYLKPGYPVSVS